MESIWERGTEKPSFEMLSGDISTDVLIIGGGITGILCGYMLKGAGVDCVIAEAGEICGKVTKNTTAKVTYHHGAVFDKMIRRFGIEKAGLYIKAQKESLEAYKALSKKIDCDFEERTSYVYSLTDREKIEKEVNALNRLGAPASFTQSTELPFSVAGAISVAGQAQFNPLKFVYALAKGQKIFEHTEITDLTPQGAVTARGSIKAKRIIVATHFPFLNRHGLYFLKMYQHRSYVLALENTPHIDGMYVDASDKGLSFREYGGTLLLGGGGHRTGKQGGGWQELSEFAQKHYPDAREVCRFATQDCKTLDDIAYIGKYSKHTPTLYAATGYNKWGMTSSMTAARILSDLVREKENEYSALFSPSRSIIREQLFINAAESALGLITPTAPRCTHLGCALKYNRQEHSWDCSCHGSRFDEDGKVLDNPARKCIKPKKHK